MNYLQKILLVALILSLPSSYDVWDNQVDSVQVYFSKINKLVEKRKSFPADFLDIEHLLANNERLKGAEKAENLLKLFTAFIYDKAETANKYNDEALRLSREVRHRKGELTALYNRAYLEFVQGQFNEAIKLVLSIERNESIEDFLEVKADCATLKSDIYTERGQFDMALETGLKLLDLAEKTNNPYVSMKADAALSHYYLRVGNYSLARTYCLKGLDLIIELKEVKYIYPKIDEMARMTAKLGDRKKALEIYDYYLKLERKLPPPGSYIKSVVYMNIADIYIKEARYKEAQLYLTNALKLCYDHNYGFRIPRALILQGELHLKQNDTANAILSYEKSLETAEEINAFDVVKSNSAILGNLYEATAQPAKAYEYKTLHRAITDSLFSDEKEQRINILETRRKIKDVTQENKVLALENEAQRVRYRSVLLILVFALTFTGLAFFSYLKVKGKNRLLYDRTVELASVQLQMHEKLRAFQKSETKTFTTYKEATSTKQSQSLDGEVKDIILGKLKKLEEKHFYIDQNCNLYQLSEQLKTNPKYLSQVINQEKKSNFNNYINELRINYLLARLLRDPEFRKSKLSYIAVSVGYNNLNTFNSAFKKRQGILPSFFIDQLNGQEKKS
ncbi:MAG: helix-turn-helix domain-containing protein [Flavobacteriaceae bacterium]